MTKKNSHLKTAKSAQHKKKNPHLKMKPQVKMLFKSDNWICTAKLPKSTQKQLNKSYLKQMRFGTRFMCFNSRTLM